MVISNNNIESSIYKDYDKKENLLSKLIFDKKGIKVFEKRNKDNFYSYDFKFSNENKFVDGFFSTSHIQLNIDAIKSIIYKFAKEKFLEVETELIFWDRIIGDDL